jgi:hypothetical protein
MGEIDNQGLGLPQARCPCYTLVEVSVAAPQEGGQGGGGDALDTVKKHVEARQGELMTLVYEGDDKHELLGCTKYTKLLKYAERWFMQNKHRMAGVPEWVMKAERLTLVAGPLGLVEGARVAALGVLCLVEALLGVKVQSQHTAICAEMLDATGKIVQGIYKHYTPHAELEEELHALAKAGVKCVVVPGGWVVGWRPAAAKAGLDIHGVRTMDELIYLLAPQAFKLQPSTMPVVVELSDVAVLPLEDYTTVRIPGDRHGQSILRDTNSYILRGKKTSIDPNYRCKAHCTIEMYCSIFALYPCACLNPHSCLHSRPSDFCGWMHQSAGRQRRVGAVGGGGGAGGLPHRYSWGAGACRRVSG